MTALADRAEATARRVGATPLLLAAMAAAGAYIVFLGSKLTFLLDDWGYILFRREGGFETWVRPDNEHFVAGPVTVWKLMTAIFGIESMLPYKLVSTALFLIGVWFLYLWVRRRVGEWAALFGMVALLFCGAAFDDLLWFASITFLGAMAGGLGMLVALDRRDERGDRLACLGLTISLIFTSLWLAFAVGAALDILLRRHERPWPRRAFIVVVPGLIYAAWWIGWGHEAESALSLHNALETPAWVFNSIAAAIAAVLGLAVPAEGMTTPNGLDWGRPLAAAFIVLALWRLYKMPRVPRSLWVVLAIAFTLWILGGLDVKSGRDASSSRYQYTGVAFLLMIVAGLLSGVRFQRRLLIPALVVLVAAVLPNVAFFHEAYESYHHTSQIERADLAALEITRGEVDPAFRIEEADGDTGYVPVEAGTWFAARDDLGSPAYDEAELAAAEEFARVPGDKVMAAALGLGLAGGGSRPAGSCRTATIESGELSRPLPPGGVALRSTAPVGIALGRFSASYPAELGELTAGEWTELRIPTDNSPRPWLLEASGEGDLTVCPLGRG